MHIILFFISAFLLSISSFAPNLLNDSPNANETNNFYIQNPLSLRAKSNDNNQLFTPDSRGFAFRLTVTDDGITIPLRYTKFLCFVRSQQDHEYHWFGNHVSLSDNKITIQDSHLKFLSDDYSDPPNENGNYDYNSYHNYTDGNGWAYYAGDSFGPINHHLESGYMECRIRVIPHTTITGPNGISIEEDYDPVQGIDFEMTNYIKDIGVLTGENNAGAYSLDANNVRSFLQTESAEFNINANTISGMKHYTSQIIHYYIQYAIDVGYYDKHKKFFYEYKNNSKDFYFNKNSFVEKDDVIYIPNPNSIDDTNSIKLYNDWDMIGKTIGEKIHFENYYEFNLFIWESYRELPRENVFISPEQDSVQAFKKNDYILPNVDDKKIEVNGMLDAIDLGRKYAFSRGFGNYFAYTAQLSIRQKLGSINVPQINDSIIRFKQVNSSAVATNSSVDVVNSAPSRMGENCELSITQFLYRIFIEEAPVPSFFSGDISNFSWEHVIAYTIKDAKPVSALDFFKALYSYFNINSKETSDLIKMIANENGISPYGLSVENYTDITRNNAPIFSWNPSYVLDIEDSFPRNQNLTIVSSDWSYTCVINELADGYYQLDMNDWNELLASGKTSFYAFISEIKPSGIDSIGHELTSNTVSFKLFEHNVAITKDSFKYCQSYVTPSYEQNIILSNGYTFEISRYRAGYIEQTAMVLSPRREGFGIAFLEFRFPTPVFNLDVDLSLWSATEYLSPFDSKAVLEYKAGNTWHVALDLLNDINLPEGKEFLDDNTYSIEFPIPVTSFRFYAETTPFGTWNKGRICVGNIVINNTKD